MPSTSSDPSDENALRSFLANLPETSGLPVRTLAHAWQAAGGGMQVGRVTVRLGVRAVDGRSFTAATLHAPGAERSGIRAGLARSGAAFEVARVLLTNHGVSPADWRAWCDNLADLELRGFEADAKYPAIELDDLPETDVARLAQAVRDLARLAQGQPV